MKKKIQKGDSWEKISAKEPTLDEDEFNIFSEYVKSEEAKKWTEWGKAMREMNIGNHRLGSGGYKEYNPLGTRRMRRLHVWEKRTCGTNLRTSR